MKKILLILTCFFLIIPFAGAQTGGDCGVTEILVGEGGSTEGGRDLRAPALVPLRAYYYASVSSILLNFRYDLGQVSMSIENLTTGTISQSIVIGTPGIHWALISGVTGEYEITFTLSDGHEYIGSFEIE